MSGMKADPKLSISFTLELTETEARALDGIASYPPSEVVEAIYKHLGKSYVLPYESGLRSFLASIHEQLPPILSRLNKIQLAFEEVNHASQD